MSEFAFTDEQRELRAVVRRWAEQRVPLAHARELAEAGRRWDPELWTELAAHVGLQGLALPPSVGGSGGGPVERAVVAEEFGRVLHGGPFLSTVVLAGEALANVQGPDASDLLAGIAAGSTTATLAVCEQSTSWDPATVRTAAMTGADGRIHVTGSKDLVLDGVGADVLLVAAREADTVSLMVVDGRAQGVSRNALRVLDATRPLARIEFEDAPARRLGAVGSGWPAVVRARDAAAIFLAAESAGAAARCVEITAAYTRTRHQFGRPIGSFQAVKHPLADLHVRVELAGAAAYWAAWQIPGSDDEAMGAAIALSYAAETFEQAARDMIQLHGGIGFSWEHDAHLFLRRARANRTLLGPPREHRDRLALRLDEGAAGRLVATTPAAELGEVPA